MGLNKSWFGGGLCSSSGWGGEPFIGFVECGLLFALLMTLHEQMHGLFKIGVISSYKPLSPKNPAACRTSSGRITKLSVCGTVHYKEMLCYKINESFQEVDNNERITNSWHVHIGLEGDETSTSSARGKHNTALLLIFNPPVHFESMWLSFQMGPI